MNTSLPSDLETRVRDAYQAFRTADACELSRRENRVVSLDEIA